MKTFLAILATLALVGCSDSGTSPDNPTVSSSEYGIRYTQTCDGYAIFARGIRADVKAGQTANVVLRIGDGGAFRAFNAAGVQLGRDTVRGMKAGSWVDHTYTCE